MKTFRKTTVGIAALILMLSTSALLAESDAAKSFHQLAGLEGNWSGKGSEGQPIKVSFRMTAGGSALMSEIRGEGHENMVTMFHMDGDRLLMTHYCGVGNQPRMKVISADAKSVSFEFVDGTNIKPGDGHMQRASFTQPDATHHTEEWVFLDHGTEHKEVFTLERAK
jgi:hypothetical protein